MRILIRLVIILAIVWLGLLFSGYGILIGSTQNAAGFGLKCKYLTARDVITAQYVHTESGIVGVTDCPVLRKSEAVIDSGK
ncbi:hypothetical protein GWD52_13430 [Enterobacteriaceae bacterium 4M9]|nr:hypothetical protein [Enterobacteriaceae bacterium 4M9]